MVGALGLVVLMAARTCPPMDPADIVAMAPNLWELSPSSGMKCGYSGAELFFDRMPSPLPTVVVAGDTLKVRADPLAVRLVAVSPDELPEGPVLVRSGEKPMAASLFVADPELDPPEPLPAGAAHAWDFSGDDVPQPWVVEGDTSSRASATERWLPGRCVIRTTGQWGGVASWRHPVMVVQYRALTGRGEGAFTWRSVQGDTGSTRWRFRSLGLWRQVHLPLYRDAGWRGTIDSMAIVPLDHDAPIQVRSVVCPRLAAVWALLLGRAWARWTAVAVSIGVVAGGMATLFRLRAWRSLLVAVSAVAMMAPVVLPFPELNAGLRLSGRFIPWYVVALALLGLGAPFSRRMAAVSWACVGITAILGFNVAEGVGLQTGLMLAAGPFAFLAGMGMGHRGLRRFIVPLLGAGVGAAALHAFVSPSPSRDLLYGSLLSTLGRSYWDETVAGRTAGMFVHPLVFALVALVVGTGLLAQPSESRRRAAAALVLLALGMSAVSRAYLAILGAIPLLHWHPRLSWRVRIGIGCVVVLVAAGILSGREQGFLRGVQMKRRIEGVKVTARSLRQKPLQGIGWGRYRTAVQRHGSTLARSVPFSTPDNSYLRLLAEGGLVGGGMWCLWLICMTVATVNNPRASPLPLWAPAAGMVVMWAVFDATYWPGAVTVPLGLLGVWQGERGT